MLYIRRLILILIFLIIPEYAIAKNRCINYVQSSRRAAYYVWGIDYPYWFNVAQLQQESNCRNVFSNDGIGSEGMAQITWKVWKRYLSNYKIYKLTPSNQIYAQNYILKNCKKQAYSSHLWVMFQIYNGGPLVNKEIKRARIKYKIREVPHCIARLFCKRKNIIFNNGQSINACDINYEYSEKIYKYSKLYKPINIKSNYIFW